MPVSLTFDDPIPAAKKLEPQVTEATCAQVSRVVLISDPDDPARYEARWTCFDIDGDEVNTPQARADVPPEMQAAVDELHRQILAHQQDLGKIGTGSIA